MEKKALICYEKCLEIHQQKQFINEILHLMVHANFKLNNCNVSIDLLKRMIVDTPSLNFVNGLKELFIKIKKYENFVEYFEDFSNKNKTNIKSMHLDIISKYGECFIMKKERVRRIPGNHFKLKHPQNC